MNPDLLIRRITVSQLEAFVASEEYQRMRVVPISPQRALSHARNPRANPGDLALVLIYVEGNMEAYLGVLPDTLHFGDQKERCGWLSCLWVNPELRGKGIAKKLINTVFETWDKRILVTEFTPEAKGLYDSTRQFVDFAINRGLRGYLRPDLATILPAKSPRMARIKGLLKLADLILSVPNTIRLWAKRPKSILEYEQLEYVTDEMDSFIRSFHHEDISRRGKAELNWMTTFPWIQEGNPMEDEVQKRYHFTAVCKRFETEQIVIRDPSGHITAYLMISYRDGFMKLPYAYFDDPVLPSVVAVLMDRAYQKKATTMTVFEPRICGWLSSKPTLFFHHKPARRHYMISNVFSHQIEGLDIVLRDGDADAGMT